MSSVKSTTLSSHFRNEAARLNSSSLDSLKKPKKKVLLPEIASDAVNRQTQFLARMSGTADSVSSSGLYGELTSPTRPVALCVKCGSHASLCMHCSDQFCENAITFYRKTRAAGAASLFSKAFVEAGNSKLVKFMVFRLLKNSYEARNRKQLKMKTVVERLFGTNVIYIPFNAWRRYTRQNIIHRKEKSIQQLTEKVASHERRIEGMSSSTKFLEQEIAALKEKLNKANETISTQESTIRDLNVQLKNERKRVVGLSAMTAQIETYSTLVDQLVQQQGADIRHYLHNAATSIPAYNYSHIYGETTLCDIINISKEKKKLGLHEFEQYREFAATSQILIDWVNYVSVSVGHHNEASTGKSFNKFLPKTDRITTLEGIKSGRDLCRVVFCLIADYNKLSENNGNKPVIYNTTSSFLMSMEASSVIEITAPTPKNNTRASLLQQMNSQTRHIRQLTMEDLNKCKLLQNDPFELIKYTINLATISLDMPRFNALEIYSGREDVIHALLCYLFSISSPVVSHDEFAEIGHHVNKYQELNIQSERLKECKEHLQYFHKIYEAHAAHISAKGRTLSAMVSNTSEEEATIAESVDKITHATMMQQLLPDAEETFKHLGEAIDHYLERKEQTKIREIAEDSLEVTTNLLNLLALIHASQERRENGMKLSTEVRNFVNAHGLAVNLKKLNVVTYEKEFPKSTPKAGMVMRQESKAIVAGGGGGGVMRQESKAVVVEGSVTVSTVDAVGGGAAGKQGEDCSVTGEEATSVEGGAMTGSVSQESLPVLLEADN